ncbi:MAG: FAD:protein FMN transferase [Chloroflexi bacterium]|nr:FAD:protein FMN transferase [Chloroflexota bacterium]
MPDRGDPDVAWHAIQGDPSAGSGDAARSDPSAPSIVLPRPAGQPGLVHAEPVMGTVIVFDIRDADVPAGALERAIAHLHDVDRRFSPYKPDSEVSRLGRGELVLDEASPDLRWVMGLCDELARLTDGYFDARAFRPDGQPDPTGVVKGWAVEDAAFLLLEAGVRDFAVNGGGDIVARGSPEPGSPIPWRVGIRHPGERDRLAAVLEVRDGAVATSGTYERGAHVVDPHTGRPATELVSLTVVGSSLTWADAFATAAFAMGRGGAEWLAAQEGYEAFAITSDGWTLATPGLERFRA